MSNVVLLCVDGADQATPADVLHAEAAADRFVVVISSITVLLAGVQAAL